MARIETHIVSSQPGYETSFQTAIDGQAQMHPLAQYPIEIGRRAQRLSDIPSLAFDSSMMAGSPPTKRARSEVEFST